MKRFVLLFLLCAAFISTQALAATIVSQDWESGAGSWVAAGTGAAIVNDSVTNLLGAGNKALKIPGTTANPTGYMDLTLGTATDKNWTATWDFYSTGSRDYLQFYTYDGGDLKQLIAFGHYNGTDWLKYNYRVAFGSVNWADTQIARTQNWHAMKVEQTYVDGAPSATVKFYIDGVLAASVNNNAVYGVTMLRAGSALTNAGGPAYFDNIVLTTPDAIPEPGSMLALGTGLIGFLGFIRRRK